MVQEWKKTKVKEIKEQLKDSKIVGLLDLDKVPAVVFQKIKRKLDTVKIIVTKKSIITRALKDTAYEKLIEILPRMPVLILTNENPFNIFSSLKKNQIDALMKVGDTAPKDIWVEDGPTKFTPGPMISEFAKVGIKTKVEQGKISVIKRTKLIQQGEEASQDVVGLAQALDIKPMKQGLSLVAAQEGTTIFDNKTLDIDLDAYEQNIIRAVQNAFNLSVEAVIFTKETGETILVKAHTQAKNLGVEAGIESPDLIKDLIIKAHAQSNALDKLTR